MPTHDQLAEQLAGDIRSQASENIATKPESEAVAEEPREQPGDFRRRILRMFELADATVKDAMQAREERAYERARFELEHRQHAETKEMLRAAESLNVELREQNTTLRELNARLHAHMEAMGNSIINASRGIVPKNVAGTGG